MKFFKNKRNLWVLVALLVLGGFVYYKYFRASAIVSYEYSKVVKKDLKKTVEGSGNVSSVSELDIQQLQNGGKITSVRVRPGDYVRKGQIIATLDSRSALIQVQQAKASYDKLINGNTDPQLAILRQNLKNAQDSLLTIKAQQDLNVTNAKRNLYNSGLTAIPQIDSKIQPNNPVVSGSYICDSEAEYKIAVYQSGYAQVSGSANTQVNISSVPQKIDACGLYLTFDSTKDYSNGSWAISVPNKLSSTYISNLNNFNSSLTVRDTAILNAQNSITSAQLSLNQSIAAPRNEDVQTSLASLASANLNYENTLIRAPFDGQIGAVSAAVGQQTNSQQGVATIITKDKIAEISLNEIDIVNVKLGQVVDLTFDAIPNEKFIGNVSQINTVGKAASNVVSFAVRINIPNADAKIKSGMSVTANIIVDNKNDVLTLPSGTIKTDTKSENKNYVLKKVLQNNKVTNTKTYIDVGITNDIYTEIVSGLEEGEEVLSKTSNGSSTKTTSTFSLFGGGRGPGR